VHHILGVYHVVVKVILLCTCEKKQYMNLVLGPHAAEYVLHKMQLAACWLALMLMMKGGRRFSIVYIYTNIKKGAMNEPPLAQMTAGIPI